MYSVNYFFFIILYKILYIICCRTTMSPSKGVKNAAYECTICVSKGVESSMFNDIHTYKLHCLLEHEIQSYRCPHCDNYFNKVQLLHRHIQEKCNKENINIINFEPTSKRKKVIEPITDSEVLHMCTSCDKKFASNFCLKRHIKAQVCLKSVKKNDELIKTQIVI